MSKSSNKKHQNISSSSLKTTPPPRVADSKHEKTPSSPTKWLWLACLGLAVFTVVVFSGGFSNEFIEWDDQIYITNNFLVTQPSWANFFKAFRTTVALNYHPVTIISLMLNAAISGSSTATPFIITNTLIHAINVVLTFYLAWLLSNRNWFVAIFTALLFSVHPMRVESVTWVSERKDVLYGFFFLAGTITYIRYLDTQQRKWFIWSFVLFVLSCLSKAQAVVLPVVILLVDFGRGRELNMKLITEKWAFWVVALFFGLVAVDIQSGGNFHGLTQTVGETKKALDLQVFTLVERLLFALYGFMMYCYKLLFPFNLSGFYPYEKDSGNAQYYFYGIPFFVVVVALTVLSLRKTKVVVLGMGFFFVTVALVLQFISVGAAIMADRYTYIPYFGLFFLIAMALGTLISKRPSLQYLIMGVAFAFVALCSYLTTQQIKVWHDTGSFFGQITKVFPTDHRAYSTRGRYLGMNGKMDEGIKDLETSIKLGNTDPTTFENLGTAYGMKGKTQEAIDMFTKAIANGSGVNAYINRAVGYLSSDPQKAIADYEKAITLDAEQAPGIRTNLAVAYLNTGNSQKAIEILNVVIDQDGNKTVNNYFNRSVAYLQLGNRNACIQDLKQALAIDPNYEQAKQQLKALEGN